MIEEELKKLKEALDNLFYAICKEFKIEEIVKWINRRLSHGN